MKVDYHKLQDLIKDKLRENIDVFEDFETDRSFEGSEWLKKFAEDDKKQSIKTIRNNRSRRNYIIASV